MATTTVRQCQPVVHQKALRCLVWAVIAGSVWVELFWLPAFGQEQTKPVIKIVATGGTIANTWSGRIPFQQTIADIEKNFPETLELLDSVKFEVIDLLRIGSQDFSSQDFLNIVRTVNSGREVLKTRSYHCAVVSGQGSGSDVAHKARILLQLALTKTSDLREIQRIFDEY